MTEFQKQIAFVGFAAVIGAIVAALYQSRQGSTPPSPSTQAPSTPATAEPSLATRDLFAAVASGEIGAGFVRKDHIGTLIGVTLVIGAGRGGSTYWLSLENHSGQKLKVTCPAYLLAVRENGKLPKVEAGGTPELFYFTRLPRGFEVILDAQGSASKRLEEVWYLGNTQQPPPTDASPGNFETRFVLKSAAAGSPLAMAADAMFGAEAPAATVAEKETDRRGVQLIFSLLAGATPENSLRGTFLKHPFVHTHRMRMALRKAAHGVAGHAFFDEAEKKHTALLASLKTRIEKGEPSALATLYETATLSFATGDPEIAALVAGRLRPGSESDMVSTLPFLLEKLTVRDPEVLGALFGCALQDASLGTRIGAAIAGARLGDVRCAPILLQFQSHPVKAGDIGRLKSQATEALMSIWKLEKPLDQKKWKELSQQWASPDIPELQGLPAADRAALKAFLESKRNITPEDFERQFGAATREREPMKRHRAIEWLALSDYRSMPVFNDRMRELFLRVAAGDPDPMVRSTAASRADYVGPREKVEPALVACLKIEKDPKVLVTLIYSLANEQSKDAVPFVLALLDNPQLRNDANEVLRRMTRVSPAGSSRADWEPILREKKLLGP